MGRTRRLWARSSRETRVGGGAGREASECRQTGRYRGLLSLRLVISQIVYASSAAGLFRPDDLADILAVSRRNNARDGVTGALLYSGGNVLQALEGPEAAVEATYARVHADPRHHGVLMLYRGTADARSFPEWAMGLPSLADLPGDVRDGARTLFDLTAPGPTRAHRLLASFRAFAR